MDSNSIYPQAYPPQLTPEQQEYLTTTIKEWSIAHGLAVRPPFSYTQQDPNAILAGTAPVTLFPSLFPMNCFHEALLLQTAYNSIYAAVASDEEWLGEVAKELAPIDSFISDLWDVHTRVKAEGYAQDLSLGLFRSDYMVHHPQGQPKPSIRQVEFNTIASSFGGLASRVSSLHRYLLSIAAYPASAASLIHPNALPTNASIEGLATGLAKAHTAYGPPLSANLSCILFITQDGERNVFDQKHLEFSLFSQTKTKVFRLPFSQVKAHTRLSPDRALLFSPPAFPERVYEVTTIYFRAGYSPDEYTKDTWDARFFLERSRAIKCPSVLLHLAGTKKVQQILATPNSPHLARFLNAQGIRERVRGTFAPMYPMDTSPAGLEGRKLATDPESAKRFVLKPQREGGGNNIYRGAIPGFLQSLSEDQWPAYVLMEMIEPPAQQNVILRNGEVQSGGVICELGVYGTILWERTEQGVQVLDNDEAGYLLRTKGDQSEEGGVAAGFGAVDSVCLVDV